MDNIFTHRRLLFDPSFLVVSSFTQNDKKHSLEGVPEQGHAVVASQIMALG
jgi:hypothetical protein